ncbi:hypothetical protein RJT34_13400 [Clitoria ternatea]|uniref:Protein phosphatase n=1 Tax=Clitoria ternatea TaxID=43366 RepID=A0AAN9PK62_CLITE
MTDLFSRSFHCLWFPCRNLQPNSSERLRISVPISLPKRNVSFTHHTHLPLPFATSPPGSSPNSDPEDFDILSSTEHSDGSFIFRFANATEIREKLAELEKEKLARESVEEGGKVGVKALLSESIENLNTAVDHDVGDEKSVENSNTEIDHDQRRKSVESLNLVDESVEILNTGSSSAVVVDVADQDPQLVVNEEESVEILNIESSVAVVVGVADQDPQLPINEEESVVLDTPAIDDSKKIDRHLKLDSVEDADGQQGILSEDVADESNVAPSVSEEHSEIDGHDKAVISTVTPESDTFSDLNSAASEEVEEEKEADKGSGVDGATNNLTGAVDADSRELVPESMSLESEQVGYSATNDLTGEVEADLSESMSVSTSLEPELVANDEETTDLIVDDSIDASKMENADLHDMVPSSDLENSTNVSNAERSDYEATSSPTMGEETSTAELFLVSGAACLPHPSKALTGREDAFFSHQNWLAVADGVGHWSFEGSNAGLYIRELMERSENIVSNYENISTIKPVEVITRSVNEIQSSGSSSMLIGHFDGQVLHAANVGNTGFIIIRDGFILKKSTPMFHEFNFPLEIVKGDDPSKLMEEYTIDLHDGDVIVTATNGLFDNLYEQEIASVISKSMQASLTPQEIAELLARRAQEVGRSTSTRSPFADEAQAAGYVGYIGGKLDDVTVIVSLVQTT